MKTVNCYNSGYYKTRLKPYVIIDSIEQIIELIKDVGESLIVDENTITIYDYYIE